MPKGSAVSTIRKDVVTLLRRRDPLKCLAHMTELLEAERRVVESNFLIERQRQLIEELGYEGCDITSAQIVFDSLCVIPSLHLQDRHRLRAILNIKSA
jgi:hypothetical protein